MICPRSGTPDWIDSRAGDRCQHDNIYSGTENAVNQILHDAEPAA